MKRSGKSKDLARSGLWLGALAVLFWSFGSALVFVGAREVGTWKFVAIASLTGGALQLVFRLIWAGGLRDALVLPRRLWLGPITCFVVYGLAWPCGLSLADAHNVGAVNLINYLWPILTVLFGMWLVPGMRFTARVSLAIGLGLAGILCANARSLMYLFNTKAAPPGASDWLPYALAAAAAITWALYSALLARWSSWAGKYVTSPAGFLLIWLVSSAVLVTNKVGPAPSHAGLALTVLYGVGPLAAGYLLWEIAISMAELQALSLIAAATPVLSTIWLCCCLRKLPSVELVAAAALIGASIVLSPRPSLKDSFGGQGRGVQGKFCGGPGG